MEQKKKYWCFSCEKPCDIIKALVDGDEVYQCSTCRNEFVEEMEEKNPQQNNANITNNTNNANNTSNINNTNNTSNASNTSNINNENTINNSDNRNRINIINITQNNNRSTTNNTRNNLNNNNQNNNVNQDEYGLNNTLLFLPSTVHYQLLDRNNFIPSILNSVGSFVSSITTPILNNIFSSPNNNSNTLLSFLNNHNNDFQFNNLVNIIMSFESSLHGNPPASQRAIDNLPKIEITKENINKFKDMTCNICLEGFTQGNILRVLECKHEFHEKCIVTWLKTKNTCPVCRHELESNDPNYERRKNRHRENLRNLHRNNTNNNNNNNNNNHGGSSGMFV